MARRKATPTKRPLASPQRSDSKRPKRGKQCVTSERQRIEPLRLSTGARADGGAHEDALQLQFPVHSSLLPSLTVICRHKSISSALQLQVDLTLVEHDLVKLQVHGQEDDGADVQLSLSELFPDTYETWKSCVTTLAEQNLLRLDLIGKREEERDDWSFSFSVAVAWRKYMGICSSSGLTLVLASPKATPRRAMHHAMIWLLKRTHDAQKELSEVEATCRYRYWDEIEVLYDRFVGENQAACAQFEDQTFAMPEIYARIDTAQQLSRDIKEAEASSTDLLPSLRAYQKAAVSWMMAREKPSMEQPGTLPLCVTFNKVAAEQLTAYDPFCAAFHPDPSNTNIHMQQEPLRPENLDFSAVRGGILADEMGLGKTVEVIALVLSHRRPSMSPQLLSSHAPSLHDENEGHQDDEDIVMACICRSSESHLLGLVRCEFCDTWHHQLCTGYVANEGDNVTESSSASSSRGLWNFESMHTPLTEEWSNGFMCYHCQSNERPTFSSRTTLIVSPEPIHAQWENELSRHIREGALSVMRYPGVRNLKRRLEKGGPSAAWQVLASPGLVLARYDVVLTTYEALAADLRHVPTTEGGDRRSSTRSQHKRYAFVSSPLVALNFWRVCMDEAQVGVENTRLQAALTLSRLSASNRWVVTGTPFSSRVSELFGYLRFLRIPPYTSPQVQHTSRVNVQLLQAEHNEQESLDLGFFRESIDHNFARGAIQRVLDLLLWNGQDEGHVVSGGGILWRTGKKHVLDQLGLPPQKNEVVWCHFAAVERHFYDTQEKRIVSLVQQRQRQNSHMNDVIERDDRLWQDLLVLRQLCCHPQVGGAKQAWSSGGNSTSGIVMTMDAFLQQLINKAARECEEEQRQLIGAQNGLAALLVLTGDISGAALKYMAEISLIRANWPQFRADLLPRLHILQNLEKCIQRLYSLPGTGHRENGADSSSEIAAAVDPKKLSLLPALPALEKRISSTGLLPDSGDLEGEDRAAITAEYSLLGQSAQHIRQYYLQQVEMMHAQALDNFRKIAEEIATIQQGSSSEAMCTSGDWWNDALAVVEQSERNNDEMQLVTRVQARLSGFDTRWGTTFCSQLVSTRSLRLMLVRELEALTKRRRGLYERLGALSNGIPTSADIELSGNCGKCRDGGTGPTCVHCQLYKELEAYRKHFLGIDKTFVGHGKIMDLIDDEDLDDEGALDATINTTTEGLSVSLFIEVFKEIASCARSALRSQPDGKVIANRIQASLQTEVELWQKLQREWQTARKLLQTQHQRLGALDELVMACSQLRLRQPGEPSARTKVERLYKLEPVEVPVRAAELEADRAAAEFDLRDKMAQLRYLLQLQSETQARQEEQLQQNTKASSLSQQTQSICAVCLQEFTQRRAVFPCAHLFCMTCVSSLTGGRKRTKKTIRCPTCRRECPVNSVTVVVDGTASDSRNTEYQHEAEVALEAPPQPPHPNRTLGSLGSKLDALLKRVDMLRQENPSVKCSLFSQWSQMLELVVRALPRLGVRCFMYGTKRQLPKLLSQFQECPAACVLALPFKVGANGLNIVEATEVILVEPLLSSSIEAQAVNRVHRLGQTKCTRVHRFIVKGSVEERIYRLGHKQNSSTEQAENDAVEDEIDGDEDLQRLGVAPGRKEQEKLTMQDLQVLLHGNSGQIDTANFQQISAETTSMFWEELVVLNEKIVSRQTAYEFLERRHAAEVREETQSTRREPQTNLFSKTVALLVAKALLELPHPSGENSGEAVDPQILQLQHERIAKEVQVWRSGLSAINV